jgi:hypothetical protein
MGLASIIDVLAGAAFCWVVCTKSLNDEETKPESKAAVDTGGTANPCAIVFLGRTEILPEDVIDPKNERVSFPKYMRVSVYVERAFGSDKTWTNHSAGFLIPNWAMK